MRIVRYLKKCERDGETLLALVLCAAQAKGFLIPSSDKRTEQETLTIERIKRVNRYVGACSHMCEEFARLF